MSEHKHPVAIVAREAAPRDKASVYPEPYAAMMGGREKRPLGDVFGVTQFGVNLTRLKPGAISALRHAHTRQDEFIYVLEGHPTLVTDEGQTPLQPGMCAGMKAGTGNAHQLANNTDSDVVYLEMGDRSAGDEVTYPDDDLLCVMSSDGQRLFTRKNGKPH